MSKPKTIEERKAAESKRMYKVSPDKNQQDSLRVDMEKGIIYGAVVAQVGEAQGHGHAVEQNFVDLLAEKGSEFEKGIKMRFGHPQMSDETLGTYAAMAKNHVVDGDKVRADLHLDEFTDNSPKGKLYSYLLNFANEKPTEFGLSVCVSGGEFYRYDKDGKKFTWDQEEYYELSSQKFYIFESYLGVDFVEAGALTPEGLFAAKEFNMHTLAVQFETFLDDNPKFDKLFKSNPEKLSSFIEKRYGNEGLLSKISKLFNKKDEPMAIEKKHKFDINGKLADDKEITVQTKNDVPAIDDMVLDTESGEAIADGDHSIVDGDMAGQTITTLAGAITAIVKTPEEAAEEGGGGEEGEFSAEESIKKMQADFDKKLADQQTAFEAKLAAIPGGKKLASPSGGDSKTPGTEAGGESKFTSAVPTDQIAKIQKFQSTRNKK